METKQIISLVLAPCLFMLPGTARCHERYLINGTQVLLYKVMNWWYDCLAQDAQWLCGQPLVYQSQSGLTFKRSENRSDWMLLFPKGFADLIALCPQTNSDTALALTPVAEAKDSTEDTKNALLLFHQGRPYGLKLSSLVQHRAMAINSVLPDLAVEITGRITGLSGQKVLFYNPDSLKETPARRCADPEDNPGPAFTLSLVHIPTGNILARYQGGSHTMD